MRCLIIACLLCFPLLSTAQLIGITSEVYFDGNNAPDTYPKGHKTYRVYARLENDSTCLTSVFAYDCHYLRLGAMELWQHPLGSYNGANINPALIELDPALKFDSYVTINLSPEIESRGSVMTAVTEPSDAFETFEEGGELHLQDGAWLALNSDQNCFGKKILLAQITAKEEPYWELNLQLIAKNGESKLYYARSFDKDCQETLEIEGENHNLLKRR